MPTRYEFNKKRGHQYGIGWKLGNPMTLIERFYYEPPLNDTLLIPEEDVAKHFLLIGDTGSGKSALIRQMLDQLDRYGDTAIVYDPAQEYVKRFYRPERGDVILNPLDERSPYWPVGEEIEHEAEARTVGRFMSPDGPFVDQGPEDPQSWNLFAYLRNNPLRYNDPDAQVCRNSGASFTDDANPGLYGRMIVLEDLQIPKTRTSPPGKFR